LLGKPYSLGMEDEHDTAKFCDKASKKMGDPFKILALESVGAGGGDGGGESALGGIFSFFTKGMSGYFCGSYDPSVVTDAITGQIGDGCSNTSVLADYKDTKKHPHNKGESDEDVCKRELKDKSNPPDKHNAGYRAGGKGGGGGGSNELAFADVWAPFANGNMFSQTWGVVRAKPDHAAIDKGVAIAGSFGGDSTVVDNDEKTVFAQAEMYFDCQDDWDTCFPTAAWTMNWRGRLRRVRSPLDMAATSIEQTISNAFSQVLEQPPVTKILGSTPLASFFNDPGGSLLPSTLTDPIEQMRGDIAQQGGEAAQWVKDQGQNRASLIH
jgi:hypothetical protein